MTIRRIVWTISCAVMFASAAAAVQADFVWDATTEFNQPVDGSSTQSTANRWQYFYANPGTNSGYTLEPAVSLTGLGYTWGGQGDDASPYVANGSCPWASGYNGLFLAPSGDPDGIPYYAQVIGWKSSFSGPVNVSFSVTDLDSRGLSGDQSTPFVVDGVDYWLYKAGEPTALASGYVANAGSTGTLSVSNVAVSDGTMLYLAIGAHDHARNDLTGVTFTVSSSVPEPSVCVLMATGLIGLLAYAWRKRK
jgi:hypothetical protein